MQVRGLLDKIRGDAFFQLSVITFFFNNLTGVVAVVFQAFANRNLSPSDFGMMNSIFSMSIILGTVMSILRQWASKCFSEIYIRKNYEDLVPYLKYFFKWTVISLVIFCGMILGLSNWFAGFFNYDSLTPFFYLCLFTLVHISVPLTALLESFKKFFITTFGGFLGNFLKLAFAGIFIYGSFTLSKAFMAHAIAIFVTVFVLGFYSVHMIFKLRKEATPAASGLEMSGNFLYFLKIGLPTLFITFVLYMDIPLARRALSPEMSGEYATANVTAMMLYVFGTINIQVFYVTMNDAFNRGTATLRPLFKGLLFTTVMTVVGLAGLNILMTYGVNFLQQSYANSLPSIRLFSIAIIPYIYLSFLVQLFISFNHYRIFFPLMVLLLAKAFWIVLGCQTVMDIIWVRLVFGTVMVAVMGLYFSWKLSQKKRLKST